MRKAAFMDWKAGISRRWAVGVVICALGASGCSNLRFPRIDPSGERIFLPAGTYTTPLQPFGLPTPAYVSPSPPPRCVDSALGSGVLPSSLAPSLSTPPVVSGTGVGLVLNPSCLIAPVGSEVVLRASVYGDTGSCKLGERVEWILSQESVGHIVAVGDEGRPLWRKVCGQAPRKLSGNYAIGRTSSCPGVLARGTTPHQVPLLAGETWLSVTAATEGTSRITAYTPGAPDGVVRTQTATVHWVDGQWVFPAPAIVAAGQQHMLTTTITRQSNSTSASRWVVRYEIVSGAPASFAPNAGQTIEVPMDARGAASVEIAPGGEQHGVTHVAIQVIQPSADSSVSSRVVLGQGSTTVTWSAPQLKANVIGPEQVETGETISYKAEISNTGDLAASEVTANDVLPDGLTFLNSNPPAQVFGNRLQWQLGELPPHSVRSIQINCRTSSMGQVRNCITVQSAGGHSTEACSIARVYVPALKITVSGPEIADVGDEIQFRVTVTNISEAPLTGLVVRDEFDAGLRHPQESSPIKRPLADLSPGQESNFAVTFRVASPGRLCHRIRVTADGDQSATAQACISATRARPIAPATFSVTKIGPASSRVGQLVEFVVRVVNTGQMPIDHLRIADQHADSLTPTDASMGFYMHQRMLVWDVDGLPVGAAIEKRVRYECTRDNPRACNRVTVSSASGVSMSDETCLEILRAETEPGADLPVPGDTPDDKAVASGELSLTVSDLGDPVRVGQSVVYLIGIENGRNVNDKNIILSVSLPLGLQIQNIAGPVGHRIDDDGRSVHFLPIAELRAGEKVAFRLECTATLEGQQRIRAVLESLRLEAAMTVEADTTVFVE